MLPDLWEGINIIMPKFLPTTNIDTNVISDTLNNVNTIL